MSVEIRYFASVRERLGARDRVELTELSQPTVAALLACLRARSADHAAVLDPGKGLRMACNQLLCNADQPLVDGDEVAFFPPVTGG
jgi:molybdopterin synthase sulfur carrier subunit